MKILKEIYKAVFQHAEADAPLEACGYLAGNNRLITKYYRMTNMDKSEEHFSFDPKEQFQVLKTARSEGLEILAIFHSHPATPPLPSIEDIRLAYDNEISYVIVSLVQDQRSIKSFKIRSGKVISEPIERI